MTTRPVFLPSLQNGPVVRTVPVSFKWHPGFALSQKQKNVQALHAAAANLGLRPLLEISTKSDEPLGRSLSAFNLRVGVAPDRAVPIEIAYQASKMFEHGGPFSDIYAATPRDAKRDQRLRSSGRLVAFCFGGLRFPVNPPTAFYDWLFLRALVRAPELLTGLIGYAGFTDIEFNPERSLNCQARACATAVSLYERGLLIRCAKSFARFLEIERETISTHQDLRPVQMRFDS